MPAKPPLFVDLDGSLIAGDTLWISIRALARRKPWLLCVLPAYLVAGRAGFKSRVARLVTLDPDRLPYREDVVAFVHKEKMTGRPVILATAANREIADAAARKLGVFDAVIASDARNNLKGRRKLDAILAWAGNGAFDYVGDSATDLPIFQAAQTAILVRPSARLARLARASCRAVTVLDGS